MARQKYDGGLMQDAALHIRNTHNTLVQNKEDLDRYLKTNLSPEWQSNSSYAYQSQQQTWNTACDDVQQMLENVYNALEIAMGNAAGVENALEKMWS
jgi:WXG100 family type VII secretion target